MILYEHFVKTRRLDLLQLLQALRLEGDLAVERSEVGGNGLLLSKINIWNRHFHKVFIANCKSIKSCSCISIVKHIFVP